MLKPAGATTDDLAEALHTFPVIMKRRLNMTPITVEQWWETDIESDDGITVHFVGKCDAVSMLDNELYMEEHKFTSGRGFGEKRITQYLKSRQPKGYVYLAQKNLKSDKKIRGVAFNFFLKMTNPKLEQRITYVGPKDLKRFEESVINTAKEVLTAFETDTWRESLDECYGFFGKCPFTTLCEFDDNEEVRNQLYTQRDSQKKFEILDAK